MIPGDDGWSHLVPILFSPGVQEKELVWREPESIQGVLGRPEEAEGVD